MSHRGLLGDESAEQPNGLWTFAASLRRHSVNMWTQKDSVRETRLAFCPDCLENTQPDWVYPCKRVSSSDCSFLLKYQPVTLPPAAVLRGWSYRVSGALAA